MHGDLDQHTRMAVLSAFKAGTHHVLVATDVAARGLDIRSIKTVVNFDAAKDIETHVHRIGRTGRAGDKEGVAITLVSPKEARFAGKLPHPQCYPLGPDEYEDVYVLGARRELPSRSSAPRRLALQASSPTAWLFLEPLAGLACLQAETGCLASRQLQYC